MKFSLEIKIIVFLTVILGILFLFSWQAKNNSRNYRNTVHSVEHTHHTLMRSEEVLSLIEDIESGGRGYAIAGDNSFLSTYHTSSKYINSFLSNLQSLSANNPLQLKRLDTLKAEIKNKIDFTNQIIAVKNTKGSAAAQKLIETGEGVEYMDKVKNVIDRFQNEENRLLQLRKAANEKAISDFNDKYTLQMISILILFIILFIVIRQNLIKRKKAERSLIENQQLLQSIIDNTSSFIYVKDLDGKYIMVNNSYSKMFGLSKTQLVGKTAFDLTNYESALKLKEQDEEILKEDKMLETEIRASVMGEPRDFFSVRFPVKNAEGNIYATGGVFTDITEIKKQSDLVHDLYDNAPAGYYSLDTKANFINANSTTLKWLGYEKEELIGKSLSDILTPESLNVFKESFPVFKEKGYINELELCYQRKDGSIFPVLINASAVKNEFGDFLYSRSTIFDITERKIAEQKIEESEKRLKSFFKGGPDAIVVINEKEQILEWNPKAETIFGFTAAEVIGRPLSDTIIPLQFREAHKKGMAHFLKTGDGPVLNKTLELQALHKQGHEFNINLSISNVKIHGEWNFIAFISDITERKKLEEALQNSKEKFLKLFYSSPLAMVIRNLEDGKVLDVNEEYESITGYKKEEVVGNTTLGSGILLNHDTGDDVKKLAAERISLKNVEATIHNKKNVPINVIVSMERIRLENKECILTGILDITERKKLEENLKIINKEMESFTYSVSHDLRAPLRIINGYAEIIKQDAKGTLPDEPKRMLENIILNAKRMGNLIDDLLNFSRLGRKELISHNTDMNTIVQSIVQEQLNGKDNYKVKIHNLPAGYCDGGLIKQVWENLISNAVKYSAKNHNPSIEIGYVQPIKDIVYFIRDNGTGFDMKYYDKLFGVFQRLHKANEFEGTGVGLALTHRIITKHGGKIWAESKLNEGTTFYFTLSKT